MRISAILFWTGVFFLAEIVIAEDKGTPAPIKSEAPSQKSVKECLSTKVSVELSNVAFSEAVRSLADFNVMPVEMGDGVEESLRSKTKKDSKDYSPGSSLATERRVTFSAKDMEFRHAAKWIAATVDLRCGIRTKREANEAAGSTRVVQKNSYALVFTTPDLWKNAGLSELDAFFAPPVVVSEQPVTERFVRRRYVTLDASPEMATVRRPIPTVNIPLP